jgi:hypothetical protein
MTCIAGLTHKGKVYIGGDSAGFIENTVLIHANGKVFRHGQFVFGCCGKRRFSEIVRYAFNPPAVGQMNIEKYMATKFIDALRKSLKRAGYLKDENGQEGNDEDAMLVGVKGRLFYVPGDFSASAIEGGLFATGAAGGIALGALAVTEGKPPKERILLALQSAEKFTDSARGPFHVEVV